MVTRGRVGVAHPAMTTSLTGTDLAMWQLPISSYLTAMAAVGADRHVGDVLS